MADIGGSHVQTKRAPTVAAGGSPEFKVAQARMNEAICKNWFHDLQARVTRYNIEYSQIFDPPASDHIRRDSAPTYFERGRGLMLEILSLLEKCEGFLNPKQTAIMGKNLKGLRKKLENIARDLPMFHGTPFEGLRLPNLDGLDLEPIFAPFRGWQRV